MEVLGTGPRMTEGGVAAMQVEGAILSSAPF